MYRFVYAVVKLHGNTAEAAAATLGASCSVRSKALFRSSPYVRLRTRDLARFIRRA